MAGVASIRASDSRTDFRVVPTESRTQSATAHSRDRYRSV